MRPHIAKQLASSSISIPSPSQTRLLSPITSEPCIQLREGLFDINSIGAFSYMGGPSTIMRNIDSIGRFSCIAGGVITGQPEHPQSTLSPHPLFSSPTNWQAIWHEPHLHSYLEKNKEHIENAKTAERAELRKTYPRTKIGNEVWIGQGAFIKRGVHIGDGAIIAAHAVVTHNVPPFAVVAGVPAKIIKFRHPPHVQQKLLDLNWWAYGLYALHNVSIHNPELACDQIRSNIATLSPWQPTLTTIPLDQQCPPDCDTPPTPPAPTPPQKNNTWNRIRASLLSFVHN